MPNMYEIWTIHMLGNTPTSHTKKVDKRGNAIMHIQYTIITILPCMLFEVLCLFMVMPTKRSAQTNNIYVYRASQCWISHRKEKEANITYHLSADIFRDHLTSFASVALEYWHRIKLSSEINKNSRFAGQHIRKLYLGKGRWT